MFPIQTVESCQDQDEYQCCNNYNNNNKKKIIRFFFKKKEGSIYRSYMWLKKAIEEKKIEWIFVCLFDFFFEQIRNAHDFIIIIYDN